MEHTPTNQVYNKDGSKPSPSSRKTRTTAKSDRKGDHYEDLPGAIPDTGAPATVSKNARMAKDVPRMDALAAEPAPTGIQSIVPLFLDPSLTKPPPPPAVEITTVPPPKLKGKGKKKQPIAEPVVEEQMIPMPTLEALPAVDPLRAGVVSASVSKIKYFRDAEDDWASDEDQLTSAKPMHASVPPPLSTSFWNIHAKTLLLSFPASLCFIAFFAFLLTTSSTSSSVVLDSSSRNNLPTEVTAVLTALEAEMLSAAEVLAPLQTAMRSYSTPPPSSRQISYNDSNADSYNYSIFEMPDGVKDFLTNSKVSYLERVAATQRAIGDLVAFYGRRPAAFSLEGYSLIRDGLQITCLDRARNSVIGAGDVNSVFDAYASAGAHLVQFTGMVQLRAATVDPGDLVEMERSFAIAQWSHSAAYSRLMRIKKNSGGFYVASCGANTSTSCTLPFMAPIDDANEYNLLWQSEAAISIFEQFLRYGSSMQQRLDPALIKLISPSTIGVFSSGNQEAIPYRTRTGTQSLIIPSSCSANDGLIPTSLLRESISVRPDAEWLMTNRTGTTFGFSFLNVKRRASYYSQWTGASRRSFAEGVQSNAYIRSRVGLVIQYIFLGIGAFAILLNLINVIYDTQQREKSFALNVETKVLTRSLTRMRIFANAVGKFESGVVQEFVTRFTRLYSTDTNTDHTVAVDELGVVGNSTPSVEAALYKCFLQFKDLEPHLPQTLLHPPRRLAIGEGPFMADSSTGLMSRPAMAFQRGLVAMRVSLTDFHSQFIIQSSNRQKASHHELQQLLSLLNLFSSVASSPMAFKDRTRAAPTLIVYPDSAVLWLNLSGAISYPCLRAVLIGKLLLREARERLRNKHPSIVIACGDAFIGHVGNLMPEGDHASEFGSVRVVPHTCFTAVGPLVESLDKMSLIAEAHKASHTLVANRLKGGVGQRDSFGRGRTFATDSSASVSATSKTTGSQMSDAHEASYGGTGGTSPCLFLDNNAVQQYQSDALRIHDDDMYINGDWVQAPEQPVGPTPAPMTNRVKNRDAAGATFRAARLRATFIYKNYLKENRSSALVEGASLVLPKIIHSFMNEDKLAASEDEDNALVRAAISRAIHSKQAPCSFMSFGNENGPTGKELPGEARGQSKSVTGQYVFRVLLELFASNHGAGTNTNNNRLKVSVGQSAIDPMSPGLSEGSAAAQIGSFLWAALSLKDTRPQHAPQPTGGRVFFSPEVDAQARAKKKGMGALNINIFVNRPANVVAAEQMLSFEEFEMLLPEVAMGFMPVEATEVPLPPSTNTDPFMMSSGLHTSPHLRAFVGTLPPQWFAVADLGQGSDGTPSKVVLCPIYAETILTELEELGAWKSSVLASVSAEGLHHEAPDPHRQEFSIGFELLKGPHASQTDEPLHRLQWPAFVNRVSSSLQGTIDGKCETLGALYCHFVRLRRTFDPLRAKILLQVLVRLKSMLLVGRVAGGAVVPSVQVLEGMVDQSANSELVKMPMDTFLSTLFDPTESSVKAFPDYLYDSPHTVPAPYDTDGQAQLHPINSGLLQFAQPSINRAHATQLLTVVATIDRMIQQILRAWAYGGIDTSDQQSSIGFVESSLW